MEQQREPFSRGLEVGVPSHLFVSRQIGTARPIFSSSCDSYLR